MSIVEGNFFLPVEFMAIINLTNEVDPWWLKNWKGNNYLIFYSFFIYRILWSLDIIAYHHIFWIVDCWLSSDWSLTYFFLTIFERTIFIRSVFNVLYLLTIILHPSVCEESIRRYKGEVSCVSFRFHPVFIPSKRQPSITGVGKRFIIFAPDRRVDLPNPFLYYAGLFLCKYWNIFVYIKLG